MKRYIGDLVIILTGILAIGFNVGFAADALYRLMHNDHDALIIGQIIELSEKKINIKVEKQIISSKELNSSSPINQIPLEKETIIIDNVEKYSYFYDTDSIEGNPQIGDYVLASVNKKGFSFVNAWGIYKVDSLDYKKLNILFPKDVSKHSKMDIFAIKTFINSNGKKNSFSFNGDTAELSLDRKVIYKADDENLLPSEDAKNEDIPNSDNLNENLVLVNKEATKANNALLIVAAISCFIIIGVITKPRKKQ